MSEIVLGDSDNGQTVTVAVGTLLVLRISENPTTGYRWAIEQQDTELLDLQSSDYTATTEGLAGSGGERGFTFRATQAGTTELRLKMWREWVGDSSVVRRYAVTIQIQG